MLEDQMTRATLKTTEAGAGFSLGGTSVTPRSLLRHLTYRLSPTAYGAWATRPMPYDGAMTYGATTYGLPDVMAWAP